MPLYVNITQHVYVQFWCKQGMITKEKKGFLPFVCCVILLL